MSAPAETFGADRRGALRRLQVAAHLAWLVPLVAYVAVAALLYRQAINQAEQQVAAASRIAQEHALKLFETNAMLLQRMLDLVGEASDAEALAEGAELHARLKSMSAGLPQVQGLFIMGADARMLANSIVYPPPRHIDYSDRESFKAHLQPGSGVFFTGQLRSRISGEPFFDMSVRRSRADGSHLGNVSVSLRPAYLTDFYAELAESRRGLLFSVFKADGRLIARWPTAVGPEERIDAGHPMIRAIAAGASSGSGRAVSYLDGKERLRSFRQMQPYPVFIAVAQDLDEVRAGWLRTIGALALFAVPATLVLTWMTRVALARTRREVAAAERLDDETLLRQRMEVALVQSQKLEALGRLTGGVAHDFNNLLMVITSNLYVHRRKHPEVSASPQLAAMDRAVAAGVKLTRQLLSFSRRQALVFERIDLGREMPALIELIAPVLGKSIELKSRVDEDLPAIEVDRAELELALINLTVNAKDAMPGGGSLEISARAGPGDTVVIEFADSGSGIAPEIAGRVFEPFFTTKPVGQGTGLGLSQVQGFCVASGGTARIEPRPGGGTRVLLELPGRRDATAAPAEAATAAPVARRQVACKLLLVEDNEAVAAASREMLESLGCKVERAADGEAALARLAAADAGVEIVLSDIEMPGSLDGIALAERISERHPTLPVLLMTGYAERLQEAVRRRFDVLPKPVAPDTLADAIARKLVRR